MLVEALLDQIEAQGSGLLITVDEVRPMVEEVVLLVSTYQLLVREGHKVALVMAGLPSDVTGLVSGERIAFLRRARLQHIGLIDDAEMRSALRMTFEAAGKSVEREALELMTSAVGGFAYMLQLVGYFMWEEAWREATVTALHARFGIEQATEDL